jgi:hypothetical protein
VGIKMNAPGNNRGLFVYRWKIAASQQSWKCNLHFPVKRKKRTQFSADVRRVISRLLAIVDV